MLPPGSVHKREAEMCRSVQVLLTESERKATTRMWGIMVPIYASVGLLLLASLAFDSGSRDGRTIAEASAAAPAAHTLTAHR